MTLRQFVYRYVYMLSPGWSLTKALRKGSSCQQCGQTEGVLHLHHEEYRWHGQHPFLTMFVPNLWDPMKTLCQRCHRLAHSNEKRRTK